MARSAKHDSHDQRKACEKWDRDNDTDRHGGRHDRHHDRHRGRDEDDNDRHWGRHERDKDHDRHCGRETDLSQYDVELDQKRDGVDLSIDVDTHGKKLDIDIDLGSLDLELDIDTRLLCPDESAAVLVQVGGEANAIGDETLATGDILSQLVDLGSVTVAFGSAVFEAAAHSAEQLVYAAADTFADVAGADIVVMFTEKSTFYSADGSIATEKCTTSFVAIDFEDFDFATGPVVIDANYLQDCTGEAGNSYQLDGNLATLNVDAVAEAENSLVDVMSSLLTVEDQLSSVTAIVVTAGG